MTDVLVLIPNYNHAKYLGEAIESALAQTKECDVLVVDDGSTDKSKDIINSFAINKIFKTNRGPGHTRNTGINWAIENKYDFIQFLDADDKILPNKVEVLFPIIKSRPEVGIVYDDYFHTYLSETCNVFGAKEYKRIATHEQMWVENLIHCNCLVRTSALVDCRLHNNVYFDENMRVAQDYDLWLRMIQKWIAWHHPEFLSFVREGENNSAGNIKGQIRSACMQTLKARNKKFYTYE